MLSEFSINGRFLGRRVSGVQRFAREVLLAASETETWTRKTTILTPKAPKSADVFAGMAIRQCGSMTGHMWEQLVLPLAAKDSLLVNLCNSAPLSRRRQVVVLHDAAIAAQPSNFTLAFRLWYQLSIRCYGQTAARLGTVSKFSATEIARHFGIQTRNIQIIGESGEHILRNPPDYTLHRRHGLEDDAYFLAAGDWAPNKNFSSILAAVARLPKLSYKFVIVGARNSRIFTSADLDIGDAIETGYVSDGQLRALFERAACFVYPSFYEGFGLPPLEAMSCGCPVLVSNTTAMPEVCSYAAMYCDPTDVDDIAQKLAHLLGSRNARLELRAAGLTRAKDWTWEKAARDLSQLIEHAS